MEKKMILKCLLFAQKNDKAIEITTSKEKTMKVKVVSFEEGKVKYSFLNSGKESSIRFENVDGVRLLKKEDEKEFLYQILSEKYHTDSLEQIIKNFEKYYLEVIEILLSKEKKNTIGYINLKNKKKIYPEIFNNLPQDESNLLFYYFTKKHPLAVTPMNGNVQNREKEMLLVEQANLSQKKALNNALNKRISIIEGPPGTGKTTTILNILANLIYQNKKALVVSKNNSAIENIVEELTQMDIPRCYIRMRKF